MSDGGGSSAGETGGGGPDPAPPAADPPTPERRDAATEVVVALDYPGPGPARGMADRLPAGTWCKVGLELFAAAGPGFVEELAEEGHPVFLDLKLHDIPNTVEGAVRSAVRTGARMLTVHASGGREMTAAAAEAAREAAPTGAPVEVLAVTVLTSLDEAALEGVMGEGAGVEESVLRLARLARDGGADGVVASVGECRRLKEELGEGFRVATPGIRLPGDSAHDQQRVATPADAARAGSDYLVVGRSITQASDPAAALERVREGVREGSAAAG